MSSFSIVIVDDSVLMAQAIEDKLSLSSDFHLKGVFQDGCDFLEYVPGQKVDLVLMDVQMPGMNGIEVTKRLKEKHPQIKVVMLTVVDSDQEIFDAIQAGADGYLLKDVSPQDLHEGILQTLGGGAAMTPSIARKSLQLLRNVDTFKEEAEFAQVKLTNRETDVLLQVSKGLDYKAIAENLFISPPTVRKHIENIYKKLQVHSKLEAVRLAQRNNLI
ncbi:response regulator [Phaeocystidibacter marisrubri]|uniref:Response regulator transcription factor n=1 Tax=Phaeocystidibacter marisrubri TaxID=1577780 RepID=A0A6L3ZIW6_9FLAO|nr:response regulator transcription factor [Phaeocystidibacter marisrubri]KAB2817110.1 response regulator transcription factor [Phaeocystidibacter marisrubri]GGH76823.1 DNA-binding response regulator [Phaeocystidibacter marisrubri]